MEKKPAGRPPKKDVIIKTDAQPNQATKDTSVEDALKEQNALLQEQMRAMQEQMQQLMAMQIPQSTPKEVVTTSMDRWVDIVHLNSAPKGGSSHIEIPSRIIDFYNFGDVRSIRLNEFQELIGKYRSWFEKGIIALSAKDSDLARKEGLLTDEEIPLKKYHVESLVNMTVDELKNLYETLNEGHKSYITRLWSYGYYELGGAYKDVAKVQLLNQVSNGAMENILKDLLGR